MSKFLAGQMDYIYFLYGLGFFMLASVAFPLSRNPKQKVAWLWFALFGVTHGIYVWLELFAVYWTPQGISSGLRLIFSGLSFILLVECGRASAVSVLGKKIRRWVFVPLFLAIAVGAWLWGLTGVNVMTRYFLGVFGGLGTALVFFFSSRRLLGLERWFLAGASVVLGCYALTQMVVPKVGFFPADLINNEIFFREAGLPVQLVRGSLILLLTMVLWGFGRQSYTFEEQYDRPVFSRFESLIIGLVVVTTFGGWFLTEHLRVEEERQIRAGLMSQIELIAAGISAEHFDQPAMLAGRRPGKDGALIRHLRAVRDTNPNFQFLSLMGLRNGTLTTFIDIKPPGSQFYEFVDAMTPAKRDLVVNIFQRGAAFIDGPLPERGGAWFSGYAPIRSATGQILAVLGVDVQFKEWDNRIVAARFPSIVATLAFCSVFFGFLIISLLTKVSNVKIRSSESRFRTIFWNAPEAAFILAMNSKKIIEVNPFMTHLLGFTSSDFLRMTWDDLFAVKIHEVWHDIEESARHNEVFKHEYFCRNKGGKSVCVEVTGAFIQFEEKDCLLVFMHDIGMRKKMEERLQESEQHFRSLIENALDIIAIIGVDGIVRFISPSVQRATGYVPEELQGKNIFDYIHPEDVPGALKVLAEIAAVPGGQKMIEIRVRNKDGSWHHIDCEGQNRLADGAIRGIVINARDISPRKEMEFALQASEAKYRELVDNAILGIYRTTTKGQMLYANRALAQMFGYDSQEEMMALPATAHYVDLREREELIRQLREKGMVERFELRIKTKQGKLINILNNVQLSGDTLIGMAMDITDRKDAELKLNEFLRQRKAILDNIPDFVWLKDEQSRFLVVNESLAKALGHIPEDLIGKNDFDIGSTPELAEHYRADDMEVMQSRRRKSVEEWLITREGKKWIETTKTPIYDERGVVIGTAGIARDITQRKLAEDALRKLSSAIEQSPVSVMITDLAGNIEYVNPYFCQLTGYTAEEVIGQNPRFLKSGRTTGEEYLKLWETIKSGKEWRGLFYNKKKDGTFYWESASICPVRQPDGEITNFISITEDITAKKKLEDELKGKLRDLREFKEVTIDRENRMVELKKEINRLSSELGRPEPYDLSYSD